MQQSRYDKKSIQISDYYQLKLIKTKKPEEKKNK